MTPIVFTNNTPTNLENHLDQHVDGVESACSRSGGFLYFETGVLAMVLCCKLLQLVWFAGIGCYFIL